MLPFLRPKVAEASSRTKAANGQGQRLTANTMKDITLTISGMSCGHCLNAVNQAISAVPGIEVRSVQIGRAAVRVPESDPQGSQVKAAIERAGYSVDALQDG
jgi:Cu+-exporting ATPase